MTNTNPAAATEAIEIQRLDPGETTNSVVVETMPDHLRGSHRAARNWGVYPHNGAERIAVSRDEAEEIVANDPDGYARIVESEIEAS